MLSVNADKYCVLYITLWYIIRSSNGEDYCQDPLETVRRPLGSSVMLLCSFGDTALNSTFDWVSWSHTELNLTSKGKVLVNLTTEGKVHFQDPRYGRLKVFPFQGDEGNFSILIDELQPSDLGCYRCEKGKEFRQVQVAKQAEQGAETSADNIRLLVYVSAAVAAVILVLSACSYCCVKCAQLWVESPPDYVNSPANIAVVCSGTPSGGNTENIDRVGQHESGAYNNPAIYDNDEHDPDRHSSDPTNDQDPTGIICHPARNQTVQTDIRQHPTTNHRNLTRMKGQGRNQGFHRELISRLRQASLNRHYYANQAEINQQATSSQTENRHRVSFWRKKDKQKCEYENPIYNNSTDQLNKL